MEAGRGQNLIRISCEENTCTVALLGAWCEIRRCKATDFRLHVKDVKGQRRMIIPEDEEKEAKEEGYEEERHRNI